MPSARIHAVLLAIAANVLLTTLACARKVEHWPYDRLFEESDLVLIATVNKSEPSHEQWKSPLFSPELFSATLTELKVTSTLKGTSEKTIEFLHYKFANPNTLLNDGPSFVTLSAEPLSVQRMRLNKSNQKSLAPTLRDTEASEPDYLLFLRKRTDGYYEAVSGQVDPSLSVRAILSIGQLSN